MTLTPREARKEQASEAGAPERVAALRLREAAAYVGMSASWLAHSDMPRVRMGRRATVYLIADLDAYLAARRTHGSVAA